jgi:hypothetical protein
MTILQVVGGSRREQKVRDRGLARKQREITVRGGEAGSRRIKQRAHLKRESQLTQLRFQ